MDGWIDACLRGGSRIFLRRGAPLRNDVNDRFAASEYEEKGFILGEGGVHPLHPPPTSALVSACDCELLWISSEGILKRVPGPSADNASL